MFFVSGPVREAFIKKKDDICHLRGTECDWIHCVQSGVNSGDWQKLLSEKRESSFCESTCGIVDIVSDTGSFSCY